MSVGEKSRVFVLVSRVNGAVNLCAPSCAVVKPAFYSHQYVMKIQTYAPQRARFANPIYSRIAHTHIDVYFVQASVVMSKTWNMRESQCICKLGLAAAFRADLICIGWM
jgi:hypothetical protein